MKQRPRSRREAISSDVKRFMAGGKGRGGRARRGTDGGWAMEGVGGLGEGGGLRNEGWVERKGGRGRGEGRVSKILSSCKCASPAAWEIVNGYNA